METLARRYGDVSSYRVFGNLSIVVNQPEWAHDVLLNPTGVYGGGGAAELAALDLIAPPAARWTRVGDRTTSVAARSPAPASTEATPTDQLAAMVDDLCARFAANWSARAGVELTRETGGLTAAILRTAMLGVEPDLDESALLSDAFVFALSDGKLPKRSGSNDRHEWRSAVQALRATALSRNPGDDETTARRSAGFAPVMMATYSPMSAALLWAVHLLAQNRQFRENIVDEIGGRPLGAALGAPYLTNFVRELLRLYPPAYALVRIAQADGHVGGFHVPRNAKVIVSPYLLHRHPDHWHLPESFLPERFATSAPKHLYLPFGAGPTTCPGKAIGIILLQLTIAALARRVIFTPVWSAPAKPTASWALLPDGPLPARAQRPPGRDGGSTIRPVDSP